MYFKYLKYIFLSIIIISCDDIDRDNILDPKNPASERPQIITVEAFVNTHDSLPNPYNDYLLEALDQLEEKYSGKITIAEYHRRINGDYPDGYVSNDNEILYNKYFQGIDSGIKGVPDVFINGIQARVQGASSVASVLFRLEEALNSLLSKNCFFTIEPLIENTNLGIHFTAQIAKLGSTNVENILVKAVIIAQYNNALLKRVVSEIHVSNEIGKLNHGENTEIDFGTFVINPMANKVIFMITSDDELEVYQSLEVELN